MSQQDVLVIGGGVMGSSIAWRLSQQGLAVTVLERAIPGAEASSAAAGMLAPQKEATSPGPLFELGLLSRQMYPEFVLELEEAAGFQVDLLPSGMLDVAWDEASENRLSQKVAWQTSKGVSAQLLTGLQAREIEFELSPKLRSAAYFPEEKQVDNRKLVRALNLAVSRAGAKFRTGYVRSILAEGQNVKGVDLDGEKLQSKYVVIAAGSWSGLISGAELSPQKLKPVRGQMVEFQTRVPPFRALLSCPQGYLVPRADGRVIAGSTSEFVGFDKRVTVEGLARILTMAQELCPALANASVHETWAGLRPYTDDSMPYIGEGAYKGLLLATGHYRNGILLAPITARLVAELISGQTPSFDLSPFLFRRPALNE